MSDTYDTYPPVTPDYSGGTGDQTSGKVDTAKEQAGNLKDSAAGATKQVAGTATSEAKNVASEAKSQVSGLIGETRSQLSDQAGQGQKRVASGIRSLGEELKGMADKSENSGPATELVHQVASRADGVASWLDGRDPSSLLDEVGRFARQRPGTFIAIAAIAGLVAGRLTRSLVSEAKDSHDATATPSTTPSTTDNSYSDSAYIAEPTVAPATYTGDATTTAGAGYVTTDDFGTSGDYLGTGSTGASEAPLSTPEIDGPPLSVGNEPYRSDTQP